MRGNGRFRDRHRIAVVRSAADWQHSTAGRVLAHVLLILAILCVAQGLSKGVLWFAGERAYGAYTFLLGVVWVAVGFSIYRVRRALLR